MVFRNSSFLLLEIIIIWVFSISLSHNLICKSKNLGSWVYQLMIQFIVVSSFFLQDYISFIFSLVFHKHNVFVLSVNLLSTGHRLFESPTLWSPLLFKPISFKDWIVFLYKSLLSYLKLKSSSFSVSTAHSILILSSLQTGLHNRFLVS